MKIMVVEDNAIISLSLRLFLSSEGFEVIDSADSYDKAVEMALIEKPDVILMDVQLKQKKTGMDAAIEIFKHYSPHIIFCTAYTDSELVEAAKRLNCPYFVKPLDKDEIVKTINGLTPILET